MTVGPQIKSTLITFNYSKCCFKWSFICRWNWIRKGISIKFVKLPKPNPFSFAVTLTFSETTESVKQDARECMIKVLKSYLLQYV